MINVRMQQKEVTKLSPKITVLGVGGAGGNAVNNMISSGLQGCEFVVCNTDAQALEGSLAENKVQLGTTVTGGLGAGAKPEIGRAAAEESLDDVLQYLEGANMAFITCGMGGGTGTGAAPVLARACREKGILTVGVVTKPFHFEGSHRMKMAEEGIDEMQDYVDTLIVIPNQNLFRVANEKTTFAEAFKMADSVLQSGVRGVTDLMVMPGLINLDFADIRSAMLEMGKAMMGTGDAEGDRRAIEAAESAINNPLLDDVSMQGARGVIINVTGGMDMTLFEVDEACNRIRDEVDPNANIIFGSTFDEKLEGVMRVSVVATGIEAEQARMPKPSGHSILNNLTGVQQRERKMERAQPNNGGEVAASSDTSEQSESKVTSELAAPKESMNVASAPSVSASSAPVSAVSSPNIPSQGPMTASSMKARTQASAAVAVQEEPEHDMFEQQTMEVAPVTAGQPRHEERTESSALRGTVQGNAFIPPAPAEPSRPEQSSTGYGPALGSLSAQRPQTENEPPVQATPTPGLSLRPPVPGAGAHSRKKAPSLFERFTNPLMSHLHKDENEDRGEGSAQGSASGGTGGHTPNLRAPERGQPQQKQGSLNIDAPKTDSAEDELDIPAFLRRQAN